MSAVIKFIVATSKSGKKSIRQSERRRIFNVRRVRDMKENVKNVQALVESKDNVKAQVSLKDAYKAIDKAVKRGVIKKNTAARKKSRLANAVNKVS